MSLLLLALFVLAVFCAAVSFAYLGDLIVESWYRREAGLHDDTYQFGPYLYEDYFDPYLYEESL